MKYVRLTGSEQYLVFEKHYIIVQHITIILYFHAYFNDTLAVALALISGLPSTSTVS